MIGLDHRTQDGWVKEVQNHTLCKNFVFIAGRIQDEKTLCMAYDMCNAFDAVVHLAAVANVPDSLRDWPGSAETNAYGSALILDECRKHGTPLIYASTAAFYPDNLSGDMRLEETQRKMSVQSPYAAEKVLLEKYAEVLSRTFDVPTLGLRIFNAYGPRQLSATGHVVPSFMEAALADKNLHIHGDGSAMRDFIYVEDVARSFVDACTQLCSRKQSGHELLNLCSGQGVSVLELAKLILTMINPGLNIVFTENRTADASRLVGSPVRFEEYFGYPAVATQFTDGLASTLEWHRHQLMIS